MRACRWGDANRAEETTGSECFSKEETPRKFQGKVNGIWVTRRDKARRRQEKLKSRPKTPSIGRHLDLMRFARSSLHQNSMRGREIRDTTGRRKDNGMDGEGTISRKNGQRNRGGNHELGTEKEDHRRRRMSWQGKRYFFFNLHATCTR